MKKCDWNHFDRIWSWPRNIRNKSAKFFCLELGKKLIFAVFPLFRSFDYNISNCSSRSLRIYLGEQDGASLINIHSTKLLWQWFENSQIFKNFPKWNGKLYESLKHLFLPHIFVSLCKTRRVHSNFWFNTLKVSVTLICLGQYPVLKLSLNILLILISKRLVS